MEWVETTARTVDEAKDLLLDQLGVDEQDAEFEVLEEPRPGLFGRVRGQARVRARLQPRSPRSKDERRRRPAKAPRTRGGGSDAGSDSGSTPAPKAAKNSDTPRNQTKSAPKPVKEKAVTNTSPAESRPSHSDGDRGPRLDTEVGRADLVTFLTELLVAFGTEATVAVTANDEGDLVGEITGAGLGRLIGPRGGVVTAIEELCRTRLQHVAAGGSTPRFRLDIGGYRAGRREGLELLTDETVKKVVESGLPHVLDVTMSSERKLVHDRVAASETGATTRSEGDDPTRRVVVLPPA